MLHDLDLAVDRLLAVLGQGLACELLAAGPGAADPDGAELAVADLGAELVLAVEALLAAYPGGGLDAADLALEAPAGAVRRGPAAGGGRRHDDAAPDGGGGGIVGGVLFLLLVGARLALPAGALAVGGGVVEGAGEGARALALPREGLHRGWEWGPEP